MVICEDVTQTTDLTYERLPDATPNLTEISFPPLHEYSVMASSAKQECATLEMGGVGRREWGMGRGGGDKLPRADTVVDGDVKMSVLMGKSC